MNNRKRVTLTFEIDDHDGYNDEAFMRHDFLQELNCCVNDPCKDTFVMKVEDADVPQEMTAVEFLKEFERMCKINGGSTIFKCSAECPVFDKVKGYLLKCKPWAVHHPEEAVAIVERWAREHPTERIENSVGDKK